MPAMRAIDRRRFLSIGAITAGALATGASPLTTPSVSETPEPPGSFDFLFLTDTHIEPELSAADGCAQAFRKAATIPADFAIQGGDHVFDALAVDRKRADSLFDLYAHTEQALGIKVHHAIGNHDHFGLFTRSGVEADSPGYGKQMFHDRIGPTYYAFDHKGYHFVVLDTIQPTPDRSWEARVDETQLSWLTADLAKIPTGTPVIVTAHVPLITAASEYAAPTAASGSGVAATSAISHPQLSVANAWQVIPLLEKHNTLAVLQGHTHINEVIRFRGISYVTSGAVCGNWWHGTRWGIPEGFTVVSLRQGKIDWRYETYGFKTVDPQNT
jgi:3',5'-cyclic-AMP phosphodiesterase